MSEVTEEPRRISECSWSATGTCRRPRRRIAARIRGATRPGAFNLGGLLAERGDLEGAAAAYHRADQRGDPGAASNLGMLLEQDGDLSGAARAYRRAVERGHPTAAFNLGVLLERQDDHRGALRAYARAQASEEREIAEMARARAVALTEAEESQR